jgi:DNA-directed RNA polymerase subunit RPC12/RpoP
MEEKKEYLCGNCKEKYLVPKNENRFTCTKCRTNNVIVESDSKSKSQVNVTVHETMGHGPTLDYLREHGMPDWITKGGL